MARVRFENTDPRVLDSYTKMVASVPNVPLKGATNPYTAINGNMYSSISKFNQIGVRLPRQEREEFLTKYKTTLYESIPGFFQREYVTVPPALLSDARTLAKYFKISFEYASALKPKETKARKPTGKKKTKTAKKKAKAAKKKTAGKKTAQASKKKTASAKKKQAKKKAKKTSSKKSGGKQAQAKKAPARK